MGGIKWHLEFALSNSGGKKERKRKRLNKYHKLSITVESGLGYWIKRIFSLIIKYKSMLENKTTRLLCLWDFPGKCTGVGCHFLFQGIFPTQRSNPGLLYCRQMRVLGKLWDSEAPLSVVPVVWNREKEVRKKHLTVNKEPSFSPSTTNWFRRLQKREV